MSVKGCGTDAGYQRALRFRKLGRPSCGPCEPCREASRVKDRTPKVLKRKRDRSKHLRRTDSTYRRREHDWHQRHTYGITLTQKDAIFRAQGSCCAVCRSPSPNNKHGWFTEHDHETDEVRGVACHRCNILIGNACKIAGTEDPNHLGHLLGTDVLTYLRDGAAFVRNALSDLPAEAV